MTATSGKYSHDSNIWLILC